MIKKLTIKAPDDMHVHFRTGEMLKTVLPETTKVFRRGVVMGNIIGDPVDDVDKVRRYQDEIHEADHNFHPIMTLMLTPHSAHSKVIREAHRSGVNHVKFIPGTASTGSAGALDLPDLPRLKPVLELMAELAMFLLIHLELTHKDGQLIPIIDQEKEAIVWARWIEKNVPGLNLVVEHASTREMIDFVESAPSNVFATLTAHHAIVGYDDVCDRRGRIKNPLLYCKPVAKRFDDGVAVIRAMTGGNRKFFFGSDSAPHPLAKKRSDNPPAGIFTAPVVLPALAKIFEEAHALNHFEAFVSENGARAYGLAPNWGTVTLEQKIWTVPEMVGDVAVFLGGQELDWQVVT